MPTGPDHYREAEKAIEASTWQRQKWGELMDGSDASEAALDAALWEMRRAQVHATLAHAAATALMQPVAGMIPVAEYEGWVRAAAVPEGDPS